MNSFETFNLAVKIVTAVVAICVVIYIPYVFYIEARRVVKNYQSFNNYERGTKRISAFAKKNKSGTKVKFGLEQQGHIPYIESVLSEFGSCDYAWNKIAKHIGWDRDAARDSYIRHLYKTHRIESRNIINAIESEKALQSLAKRNGATHGQSTDIALGWRSCFEWIESQLTRTTKKKRMKFKDAPIGARFNFIGDDAPNDVYVKINMIDKGLIVKWNGNVEGWQSHCCWIDEEDGCDFDTLIDVIP